MAQLQMEDGGWPLGLRPLNGRVGFGLQIGLMRNGSSSINSFNTLITPSITTTSSAHSSSSYSSDELDAQSSGSFFHDKSITLGTLLGASNILELSRRSARGGISVSRDVKRNCSNRPKTWLFSLCSKLSTDSITMNNGNTPSLAHYLDAERRAANLYRRNQSQNIHGHQQVSDPNPLLAPNSWTDDGYEAPLLLSCLCGHLFH